MLRWIIALVVAGAVIYMAATVPFGGRTLVDRILNTLDLHSSQNQDQRIRKSARKPPITSEEKGTDQLTDQDRAELDKLIKSKLKEQDTGEASRARP